MCTKQPIPMFRFQEIPIDGDPSQRVQVFSEILPRLHCCRYWYMEQWKSKEMSFPYWRLYWNSSGKAKVMYKETIELTPKRILLIPPNTPFSTDIEGSRVPHKQNYSLEGNRIESRDMEAELKKQGKVLHFFIHFNLGHPFDSIGPEVFVFPMSAREEALIQHILDQLMTAHTPFELFGSISLYALLFALLHQIPAGAWDRQSLDHRVLQGIRHFEMNLRRSRIENRELAERARMSVNSYARLFKEQTGYTPGKYLQRMRVEKASNMLHHSDMSIDQIAMECGFCDRYHLSKVFARIMEIPPASYRNSGIAAK